MNFSKKTIVKTKQETKLLIASNGIEFKNRAPCSMTEMSITVLEGTELEVVGINSYNTNLLNVSLQIGENNLVITLPRDVLEGDLRKFDKIFKEALKRRQEKEAKRRKEVEERVVKKHPRVI